MEDDGDGESDPVELAETRNATYPNVKTIVVSSPTIGSVGRIYILPAALNTGWLWNHRIYQVTYGSFGRREQDTSGRGLSKGRPGRDRLGPGIDHLVAHLDIPDRHAS